MLTLTCDVCGTEFEAVRHRHRNTTACSHSCRQRAYRRRRRFEKLTAEIQSLRDSLHRPDRVLRDAA